MTDLASAVEAEQEMLQSLYGKLTSCETVLTEMKEKRAAEDERLRGRKMRSVTSRGILMICRSRQTNWRCSAVKRL